MALSHLLAVRSSGNEDMFNSTTANFNTKLPDNNPTNNDPVGSASDYILIAMIVAMMACMAVCCLCLFCRSNSRFSVCGINCDIADRNTSAVDDGSELHEVVPLTPASGNSYNLPDIESKLKADPPPPRYSEVAGSTMLDRFRWRSRRKGPASGEEQANIESGVANKSGDNSKSKSKKSERRSRLSRTFNRSNSNQQTRTISNKLDGKNKNAKLKKTATMPGAIPTQKSSLQYSASDCTAVRPKAMKPNVQMTIFEEKADSDIQVIEASHCKDSEKSKDLSTDAYDDEVFM